MSTPASPDAKEPEVLFTIGSMGDFDRGPKLITDETELTDAERQLAAEWDRLRVNNARWRVYAALTSAGPTVWLTTEFIWWVDHNAWWEKLREIAGAHDGHVEELFETDERGHWQGAPATLDLHSPRAREHPSYVPAEHEGRKRLQVAVNFNIIEFTLSRRDELITTFSAATEKQWAAAGVNVI